MELPPQPAKSIGLRFAIGPIVSLIVGGPAETAGVKVGDRILAVDGDTMVDAFGLPLTLSGVTSNVKLTLGRGEGADTETIDVELSPSNALQTLKPTEGISGQIAVNSLGLSYQPLPQVASVIPRSSSADGDGSEQAADVLQPGDKLQEVKLMWAKDDIPEALQDERYERILDTLITGWEFKSATPLADLREAIQFLPKGTELRVFATRPPEDQVVSATVVVRQDDRYLFERGLGFTVTESIQTASSPGEALTLGIQEGERRLSEVVRFLGMLPRGKVKLRHVGGPLAIVGMAKQETERGISRQLMFLTMLSMNLAILNFLPIPALDGGHMVFLVYELVRGKRADEQIEFRLTLAGVIALLALMVVVFANDIIRYLTA